MALTAVAAMYAVFLALGWFAARRVAGGSAEDLLVAGRAMPLWLATLTMTATWVDGGYLLGTAEGVYKSSLALGLQGAIGSVGAAIQHDCFDGLAIDAACRIDLVPRDLRTVQVNHRAVIAQQIRRSRNVTLIGRIASVTEHYYVISVERKLKHPAVVAICDSARRNVFG